MRTIWRGIVWLFENLVPVLSVIGLCSVVVRALDEVVEKRIAVNPQSKLWKALDRALDTGDGVLGFALDVLHKVALRRKMDVTAAAEAPATDSKCLCRSGPAQHVPPPPPPPAPPG